MSQYLEKELSFVFPDDLNWEELDKKGLQIPRGMSLVDLVIEREHDVLLVEIKDPSHSGAPQSERDKYIQRLLNNSLISEELVPKVRDSYTYLHLMKRDNKPFKYIVLLGLDAFDEKSRKGVLASLKDRLFYQVKKEADIPWRREHISDCIILTIDTWNNIFTDWPITRTGEVSS